jgi:FAD/FMN-containing dehydrogenase
MTSTTQPSPDLAIPQLRSDLSGPVIAPEDPGYDEARAVFFTGFARRPAAIVQVADDADVARVVSIARDTGVELAVRSGGHSNAGHSTSDGGIVIDLSRMNALDIEADGRTAWAETGLTAGEYTAATGARGLATGFGDTPSVGIGGITLGGGVGYLSRKHGLTIDHLIAADLVTADGRVLRVDAENDPDLFWALRGGGGNFGIATRFRFRLHELDEIVGGMLMLPATADVIVSAVAEAEAAPEELSAIFNIMLAPPMPFVPEEHHGRPVVLALLVHAGGGEEGERAIAPFRALATPIADMVRPMRYPEIYELAEGPHPVAATFRNMFVDSVDRAAAEAILGHLERASAPRSAVQLRVLGGAIARVPADATAFAHRQRKIMVNVAAMYERLDEAPVHEAWVAGLAAELDRGHAGAYVGFIGDEGEDRVHEAYPGPTWDRLAAIKRRYDPANLFRLNQNVEPASA